MHDWKSPLQVSLIYAATYIASMFFPALSAVFKERIFSDAKEKLGGKDLDLFAVNSFGSAAQAGFVFLLLPVLCSLRGIDLKDLPQYLSAGKHVIQPMPPLCRSATRIMHATDSGTLKQSLWCADVELSARTNYADI